MFWKFWKTRWRPDLLHINGYANGPESPLFEMLDWAKSVKLPTVYQEHQTADLKYSFWEKSGKSINKATCVLALLGESTRALRKVAGINRPVFTSSGIFADPLPDNRGLKTRRSGRSRYLTICSVACLRPYKGLDYLLEAIARVRLSFPDIRLKIYGDGPSRSQLIRYADELGLPGKKIFMGVCNRDELSRILLKTDIFVLPSKDREALPLALIEAMAHGCAIIATKVGDIPILLNHKVNGLLCSPKDPDSLAQQLITLIEDPAMREQFGRAARIAYKEGPFQPEVACVKYLEIYRKTLKIARDQHWK